MFPILLISKNQDKTQEFINEFTSKNSFEQSSVYTVKPLKKELSINQIRELKKELRSIPRSKRLIIIESLDESGVEVQNALLKTLEEKVNYNQFIFPIKNLFKILSTIQSRSKIIRLEEVEKAKVRPTTLALLKSATEEKDYLFFTSSSIEGVTREEAFLLLDEMVIFFRNHLEGDKIKAAKVLKAVLKFRDLLQNNNLNPQLTIDHVLIFVNKTYIS